MLIRSKLLELKYIALGHFGQACSLVRLLVLSLFVKNCEAVKLNRIPACLEKIIPRGNIGIYRILNTYRHKRRYKALPYELIQLILFSGKRILYGFRSKCDRCRSDSLVGVLRAAFCFKISRLFRQVAFAVFFRDISVCGSSRLFGNTQGVGSHICYKTGSARALDINTLVKLLSDTHSALTGKAELT